MTQTFSFSSCPKCGQQVVGGLFLCGHNPSIKSEQARIPDDLKPLHDALVKNNSGTMAEQIAIRIIRDIALVEAERDALKTENERLKGKIDKLTAQLKQARSEAEEERKSTAVEERWKNSQGEDYGSY